MSQYRQYQQKSRRYVVTHDFVPAPIERFRDMLLENLKPGDAVVLITNSGYVHAGFVTRDSLEGRNRLFAQDYPRIALDPPVKNVPKGQAMNIQSLARILHFPGHRNRLARIWRSVGTEDKISMLMSVTNACYDVFKGTAPSESCKKDFGDLHTFAIAYDRPE